MEHQYNGKKYMDLEIVVLGFQGWFHLPSWYPIFKILYFNFIYYCYEFVTALKFSEWLKFAAPVVVVAGFFLFISLPKYE